MKAPCLVAERRLVLCWGLCGLTGRIVSDNHPQTPDPDQMHLSDVVHFIARPHPIARRAPVDAIGLAHLLSLFGVTIIGVIVLMRLIWPIILSGTGGEMPTNANDSLLEANPARLVLIGIVIAPLIEELLFRSWLGGRVAAIIGLPLLASALAVLSLLGTGISPASGLALTFVLLFLSLAVVKRARDLDPPSFHFARAQLFPIIFWGSALLFALLHLSNFTEGMTTPLLVLAVLPQGLVGLILGYVRLRFGLGSAIGFHGAYNAFFISLGLLTQGLNEAAIGVPF